MRVPYELTAGEPGTRIGYGLYRATYQSKRAPRIGIKVPLSRFGQPDQENLEKAKKQFGIKNLDEINTYELEGFKQVFGKVPEEIEQYLAIPFNIDSSGYLLTHLVLDKAPGIVSPSWIATTIQNRTSFNKGLDELTHYLRSLGYHEEIKKENIRVQTRTNGTTIPVLTDFKQIIRQITQQHSHDPASES